MRNVVRQDILYVCVVHDPLIAVGTKSESVTIIHLVEVSRITLHFTNVPLLTYVCHSVAKTRPGYVQIIEMGVYLKANHSAVFHVDSQ